MKQRQSTQSVVIHPQMNRPPKPEHQKYYRSAASIPITTHFKKKRIVPVLRRKYPKLKPIEDNNKILDSWQLLQLSNGKFPEDATELNAEGMGFTSVISDDFKYFKNIKCIDLSDTNVPISDILFFPKLQNLYLNCNGITDIPHLSKSSSNSVLCTQQLEHLSLSFNQLTNESISNISNAFESLISLDLSNNSLTSLPKQLLLLKHLNNLNLSNNNLKGMETWTVLASMRRLTELDLSDNEFSIIPSMNDFKAIHKEQTDMKFFAELEYLNLQNNHIRCSDDILSIKDYAKVTMIDVRSNPFLNEIWSSIKNRRVAAENSRLQRYENVFIPSGDHKESDNLPRPCDFGRIYWEIVVSRGIICIVDDPSHQNVFELQPVTGMQNQASSTDQGIDIKNKLRNEDHSREEHSDLDTNVFSLLQSQIFSDCKPNSSINHCINEISKLLKQ